ncbi:MAG: NAD-binding protein [Syntrophothermus sp.]
MRILVIGGTLFVGPNVVTRLNKMGHEVTLFHRGKKMFDYDAEDAVLAELRK